MAPLLHHLPDHRWHGPQQRTRRRRHSAGSNRCDQPNKRGLALTPPPRNTRPQVVIGSIAIFSSLFVCIFLRSTSCDACGRCHKLRFGYRRGQRGSSGAEMVIRFHPTPYGQVTSSATLHSEPGKPTVVTDCPSGALPPHLICDSEPFIHRNGDHSSLYSRLPTHVTLLDLHSNGTPPPPPRADRNPASHSAAPPQTSPPCTAWIASGHLAVCRSPTMSSPA